VPGPETIKAMEDFEYCHMPRETEDCHFDAKGNQVCEKMTTCRNSELSEPFSSSEPEGGVEVMGPGQCSVINGTSSRDIIYIGSVFYCSDRPPGNPCQRWTSIGEFGWCKNGTLYTCLDYASQITVKLYAGNDDAKVPQPGESQLCEGDEYKIGPWSILAPEYQSISLKVYGCEGSDAIGTTPNNDTVVAGSGTDTVLGYAGSDNICGDFGGLTGDCSFCDSSSVCTDNSSLNAWDWLSGGDGSDKVCGVAGNDYIYGDNLGDVSSGGVDYLYGHEGADTIRCGGGNDWAYGGNGCDTIYGYDGVDRLYAALGASGASANDTCSGGYNQLIGGNGGDYLYGSNVGDKIWGESAGSFEPGSMYGVDYVWGNSGNDFLCPQGSIDGIGEQVYGGAGNDVIFYYASDYGHGYCFPPYPDPPNPGACGYGQIADGGDDNDYLIFDGINCNYGTYEQVPCPQQICGGGITLNGNSGGSDQDCCECNEWSGAVCAKNECENNSWTEPCPSDSGFTCFFPFVLDEEDCEPLWEWP
jgi:hypothetical protein